MTNYVALAVQILLAIITSGLLYKTLTLRQTKRRIVGEASVSEANAASILTGKALEMMSLSQNSQAATTAENQRLWTELNEVRWRMLRLERQKQILVSALEDAGQKLPDLPPLDRDHPTSET